MKILIDADACPVPIREILFRTSKRLEVPMVLVANQSIPFPKSKLVTAVIVGDGADVADDKIVEMVEEGDLVITADIPLAARIVEKDAIAIGPRGELFDANSVQNRLASRNLMDQLRSAGMETRGPKPMNKRDIREFSNVLDRTVTKLLKQAQQKSNADAADATDAP